MKDKPAFPRSYSESKALQIGGKAIYYGQSGMTLRQWYKGQVVSGQLARGVWESLNQLATECGDLADAMIKEDEEHDKDGD